MSCRRNARNYNSASYDNNRIPPDNSIAGQRRAANRAASPYDRASLRRGSVVALIADMEADLGGTYLDYMPTNNIMADSHSYVLDSISDWGTIQTNTKGVNNMRNYFRKYFDRRTLRDLKLEIKSETTVTRKEFTTLYKTLDLYNSLDKKEKESNYGKILKDKIIAIRLRVKESRRMRLHCSLPKKGVGTYVTFSTYNAYGFKHFSSNIGAYNYLLSRVKELLQIKRRESRDKKVNYRVINNRNEIFTVGGVHNREGTFLAIIRNFKDDYINSTKAPSMSENCVGVELEFFVESDPSYLKQMFVKADLYKYVFVKGDSSIELDDDCDWDDWSALEVNIIAPENEIASVTTRTLKVLNYLGARVNESCGVHVHLDVRNKNKERVFRNLVRSQKILQKLVSSDRVFNTYCKKVETDVWNESENDRYMAISSKASYSRFETIEVRLLDGCLEKTRILNWIKLLVNISNYKKDLIYSATAGATALEAVKFLTKTKVIDKKQFEFLKERVS